MQIGINSAYDIFNKNNGIFNLETYPIGDDLGYPFVCLKKLCNENNVHIDTLDQHDLKSYDKIIFLDLPQARMDLVEKLQSMNKELHLVVLESPLINKENWIKNNHRYFKKVFLWHDKWFDGDKYIELRLANKIFLQQSDLSDLKTRFCTLISCYKNSAHNGSLYKERINAVRWFEKNHPDKFDLWGKGWNLPNNRIVKKVNIDFLNKLFTPRFPSYKGEVARKHEVLRQYKFSICYENIVDVPGYVSEKLFDCLFAQCIPVYLGAPNIKDLVPENCFIDKRDFKSYKTLYDYLANMTGSEWKERLEVIRKFVNGKDIYPFSAECFAKTLFETISR